MAKHGSAGEAVPGAPSSSTDCLARQGPLTVAALQFTGNDIDVAVRLVEVLVAHVTAAGPAPLDYDALLAQVRARHPREDAIKRATVVGIGPKLLLVARFCQQHGYPNLAALAVHPDTGQPGPHASGPFEPAALAGADWSGVPAQLASASQAWRALVPARIKPRAERPADVTWYAWFNTHRTACVHVTPAGKQEIINLLMAGLDPETALHRVLAAQPSYGARAPA
jgi:hypothetical protein